MLWLLLTAAVSPTSTIGCNLSLEPGDTVIERRVLMVRDGKLEAVAVSKSDKWKGDPASRIMILGSECRVIFNQRFEDAERVSFREQRLGDQRILFVTALIQGGSGCGYQHALLTYGGDVFPETGVQSLAPMRLGHSNMDGIFVGDLGRGRGPGLVAWNAQWNDGESHYEPHQYKVVTYRWRDGTFVGPNVTTTKRKYDPDPNAVAKDLGFTFHDMTQRKPGAC